MPIPKLLRPKSVLLACFFGGLLTLTGCHCVPTKTKPQIVEATEWMPRHEFQKLLNAKEAKDDSGKNFWAKGYSVRSIEGRWANGYQEYKISVMKNPTDRAFWWMWYFDMSAADFQKSLSKLSVDGYQLVSYSKNPTPSGGDSFAAVWHKTGK